LRAGLPVEGSESGERDAVAGDDGRRRFVDERVHDLGNDRERKVGALHNPFHHLSLVHDSPLSRRAGRSTTFDRRSREVR
jgi:hypothetical protein